MKRTRIRLLVLTGILAGLFSILRTGQVKRDSSVEQDAPDEPIPIKPMGITQLALEAMPVANDLDLHDELGSRLQNISSLAGSNINGDIKEDENGSLILDRDLRRLIDYFLTLRGRYSTEQIEELFLMAIKTKVGVPAQEEALALLQAYQKYLDDSAAILSEMELEPNADDYEFLIEQRRRIRRTYLGEQLSEAFFDEDERYEDHQLAAFRITTDANLSSEEKKHLLDVNDSGLPDHIYINRQQTFAYSRIKTDLAEVGDAGRIYERVAEAFGDEAAQRYLEALMEEKEWRQTVTEYFELRNRFFAEQNISAEEVEQNWVRHAQSIYPQSKLVRLQAIESENY